MSCIYQLFKNAEREPVGFSDVYATRVDGCVCVRFMDCGIFRAVIYIYVYSIYCMKTWRRPEEWGSLVRIHTLYPNLSS